MKPGLVRLALGSAILLAACGSSGTPAGTGSPSGSTTGGNSSPSLTPTTPSPPAPTGPPTATATTTGAADVAGSATIAFVTCSVPYVGGLGIDIVGHVAGVPAGTRLALTIQANSVLAFVTEGSGSSRAARAFRGTGVTGFDAARGATVNSTLVEDRSLTGNPGKVGALASIVATVDCAGQQPGSSTVVVSGSTAGGAISGRLSPAQVSCDGAGQLRQVVVTALVQVGTRQVQALVTLSASGDTTVTVDGHFYSVGTGASVSASGAAVSADASESGTPARVHVEGAATCGSARAT